METGGRRAEGRGVRWGDVLLSAIAAVSWALVGMAGTAALGLHLLGADSVGSLGPMTAAVVALGAGGSVTPSGDVSAFGLDGAEATTAIDVAPLGVGLAGAVLLAYFFLRSLRGAGVVISPAELAARAGAVIVLFLAMLGGLAWAGHDIITIDGEQLGIDKGIEEGVDQLPDDITDKLPDGLGDIGGLLPDRLGDLAQAKAAVGFTVDTGPTLLAGAVWVIGVLVIALLASRRTPLPRGWDAVHRVVRPAASALVTVALVAVLAGLAAALYAMIGDANPKRIAGAALLGAPNGVWLGVPVGLFVPWDGEATGELAKLLPDPMDDLLAGSGAAGNEAVTLGRLAELDSRVWLLGVAAALMILFAGVLTAVRTPYLRGETGALRFAGQCAVRLGVLTALALPLLVWLTGVSADASLSVLGFDAFGAGIELHGQLGKAFLLGAAWGAGAGAVGAVLAVASGAAGGSVSALALAGVGVPGAGAADAAGGADTAGASGAAGPAGAAGASGAAGAAGPAGAAGASGAAGAAGPASAAGASGAAGAAGPASAAGASGAAGAAGPASAAGPYSPSAPFRPSNPDTNPYLRPPQDVSGAPTVAGPITPPPQRKPKPRPRSSGNGDWPPPPPPPPPPGGGRGR